MTEDLRTKRTKEAIKRAFIKLVNERGFANVTVKAIAEEGIINRQTFYNYYQDKYDLTEQLNAECLELFNTAITKRFHDHNNVIKVKDFYQCDEFKTVYDARKEILALLSIQYDKNSFKQQLQAIYTKLLQEQFNLNLSTLDAEILGNLFIDIITFVAKYDFRPDNEELDKLRQVINAVIN